MIGRGAPYPAFPPKPAPRTKTDRPLPSPKRTRTLPPEALGSIKQFGIGAQRLLLGLRQPGWVEARQQVSEGARDLRQGKPRLLVSLGT